MPEQSIYCAYLGLATDPTGAELVVRGAAAHPQFSAYVIEVARGALPTGGYTEAFRGRAPVADGAIGTFVIDGPRGGTKTLALRVLVKSGEAPLPCRVALQVSNP